MQVAAKVARESCREQVGGDRVHIRVNLQEIEVLSPFSNYLEVWFPSEVFEVLLRFWDQLVQVVSQVLGAEMFYSLMFSF